MKKLFLSLGLVAGTFAFAQSFGIKGGMNVSSISKDATLSDTKSKIGFNAGAFVNIPIAEGFSIQPEVLYNDLGSKTEYTLPVLGTKTEFSTNLGYVSVPVMVQYNITPELYLEAGPEFSFLVNSNNKLKSDIELLNNRTLDLIKKENLNTFNFGLGIGAGYYFTPNIGVTARYTAGLTNIGKEKLALSESKNNVFQVGLAYKFK